MSLNVVDCQCYRLSCGVKECHGVLYSVIDCCKVSGGVIKCQIVLLIFIGSYRSHEVIQSVIRCYIVPYSVKECEGGEIYHHKVL